MLPGDVGVTLATAGVMATTSSWREIGALMAEAQLRRDDAVTLDEYRWHLLEASARLSTARLIISHPTPALDQTDALLLEPLESASKGSRTLMPKMG